MVYRFNNRLYEILQINLDGTLMIIDLQYDELVYLSQGNPAYRYAHIYLIEDYLAVMARCKQEFDI